ncbi:histidine--tRNA ligase [Liquorilactobacillus capillatus]|uniref:Histidine--tRNA ligase n=1 Tax=Liquorilactobacillus capillatus DSM 19910 TaxID=1423731 RepID=A0A0R1MB55_9LACO|nr:histidine--tRNA ligase [Liquorilactobacillus capillatus]KRL01267.1 histidyl-tRNA synthetase [Liquorilactobacillus capillatus DSM 19910]
MKYQRPKGTTDIIPGESAKWQYIEQTARQLFQKYRYNEIRTPIFENFEVFSRTSGETSDIVTKEMYDFFDKGERHITLRPEGTAGVVRAYVENKLYGPEVQRPFKAFYMGPMFRYERPQSGRQRQFHQIGVEAFGVDNPTLDVEVMAMAVNLLRQCGLKDLKLVINTLGDAQSRTDYHEALVKYLKPHESELSDDSKERLVKNPLRILDSKDKQDQAIVAQAPSILDYLTPEAAIHFETVKKLLTALQIPFEIETNMVRGLDYYNHTIFEIMSNSKAFGGQWTTVCAGGRYNGLVEQLGGPEIPGIGFGVGVERLLLVLEAEKVELPIADDLDLYIVGIGEVTNTETLKLVQALRQAGYSAERDYLGRKPKGQFKSANRMNAHLTLTIGEAELQVGEAHLKNMHTGNEVTVPLADIYAGFDKIYRNAIKSEKE